MLRPSLLVLIIWIILFLNLCECMPFNNEKEGGNLNQQNIPQQKEDLNDDSQSSESDENTQGNGQNNNITQGQKLEKEKGFGDKNDLNDENKLEQQSENLGIKGMNNSFNKPLNENNFDEKIENNNPSFPQGFNKENEIKTNFGKPEETKFGNISEQNPYNNNGEGMNINQFGRPEQDNIKGNNKFLGFQGNEKINLNDKLNKENDEINEDNNDEKQIDENEKEFLFKIYPFLKNLKIDNIISFRALIREKDLTKNDLEKKREEWIKNENEDIQNEYNEWKHNLYSKKQIAIKKNDEKFLTFSNETKELYKEIMKTINDQSISRHQECVNIRNYFNKSSQETQKEFHDKVKLRLIDFCLEEEENGLIQTNSTLTQQNKENSLSSPLDNNISNGLPNENNLFKKDENLNNNEKKKQEENDDEYNDEDGKENEDYDDEDNGENKLGNNGILKEKDGEEKLKKNLQMEGEEKNKMSLLNDDEGMKKQIEGEDKMKNNFQNNDDEEGGQRMNIPKIGDENEEEKNINNKNEIEKKKIGENEEENDEEKNDKDDEIKKDNKKGDNGMNKLNIEEEENKLQKGENLDNIDEKEDNDENDNDEEEKGKN